MDNEIRAAGIVVPANPKNPVAKAEHIQMPDGSRLRPAFPVVAGKSGDVLEPERFYEFGAVAGLEVTLAERNDGLAHEYWLQFVPQEGFTGLTITPEPGWTVEPQYPVGKTVRVGIWNGMAVMGIV